MYRIKLSDMEIDLINEALGDPEIEERFKKKLLIISMKNEQAKHSFISKCLYVGINTVTNTTKEYINGGLDSILENRIYRPTSSLDPFMPCISCSFKISPVATAKEAVKRIEKISGIKLSERQCRRVMKNLGMKLRKCGQVPGKADRQLQLIFLEEKLQPRLKEASEGERKVFFVDAAHFVLGAFLGMIWSFTRVFVKTSPGRQRYSVLGAIDSHTKEIITINTDGNVNGNIVNQLISKIRQKYPDENITLVMDNARYQRCKFVTDFAKCQRIELLFLPSYSPNLNLIERLWKLVKKRCLLNRYYPNFNKFKDAIDSCIETLNQGSRSELHSLISLNFQIL